MAGVNGQRLEYIRQVISILSQRSNDTFLLQDYLAETVDEIKVLKRKRSSMMREYVSRVKNPLLDYESLWGPEAIKGLSGPTKTDEEWRAWSYYRKLFFENLKYKKRLREISGKISFLSDVRYDLILKQIKHAVLENNPLHMTLEEAKSIGYGDRITALITDKKRGITKDKTYIALGSNYFPHIREAVITHFNDRDPPEKPIVNFDDIPTWGSDYRCFRRA